MIYPTISELTRDEFNRYELSLATAKCARIITDEYVRQRQEAENAATADGKDGTRNLVGLINKEYRDEKAVKTAIGRIHRGEYKIVRIEEADEEPMAEDAVTEDGDNE